MADYLLFEGPMGYSLFKVAHQGDAVGHSLKEVQEGVNDLAKFGKMVQLSSFLPFEYVLSFTRSAQSPTNNTAGTTSRP
jgi:nucleolar protein 56